MKPREKPQQSLSEMQRFQPLKSILADIEPPSEDERAQWAREQQHKWRTEMLKTLLFQALSDKDFASVLCEKVASFFRGDKAMVKVLQRSLKSAKGAGRPRKWNPLLLRILLIHYAHYMRDNEGDHGKALETLIDYEKRMTGVVLSSRSMNNLISRAIKQLPSDDRDIPDWVREVIQQRTDRGKQTQKRSVDRTGKVAQPLELLDRPHPPNPRSSKSRK